MGAAVSIDSSPVFRCRECALRFQFNHAIDRRFVCPRCQSIDIQVTEAVYPPPPLFVTPSGLMLTEEALRQIVGANSPSLEDAEQVLQEMFRILQNQGLADHDSDLFEVITRSMDDPTNNQVPPASDAALRQLRTSQWNSDQRTIVGEECGICLSTYEKVLRVLIFSCLLISQTTFILQGEELMHMPCGHAMHSDCLRTWLKQTATCPFCRYKARCPNQHC